jgi:Ca-activated chloride channel family protein
MCIKYNEKCEYQKSKIWYNVVPDPTIYGKQIHKGGFKRKLGLPRGGVQHEYGFSTGGSKDINNFRQNIKNNYFPLVSDLTYEGIFYDYFFEEIIPDKKRRELFYPTYVSHVCTHPLTDATEYYISVGLNSGSEKKLERKKQNLVIVLDISGSMESPFDEYHYDKMFKKGSHKKQEWKKTKMQLANESVVSLLNHLKEDDRFGIVLFDDQAYISTPLNLVKSTDMYFIKTQILKIKSHGGTNMDIGYSTALQLFNFIDQHKEKYDNRIIVISDAMPNIFLNQDKKENLVQKAAKNQKIYTTFIGVGVDFNSTYVENITKVVGANYYSIHSPDDFKKRMDEEFDFMVTPMVFNLQLTLSSGVYKIDEVYGSPEADASTDTLLKINTLFPSKKEDNKIKGGVVLIKLRKRKEKYKKQRQKKTTLKVTYEDRDGKAFVVENVIKKISTSDQKSVLKAILLSQYVRLLKDWILWDGSKLKPYQIGWERGSRKLTVSKKFKNKFREFSLFFKKQMTILNDNTLKKEMEILNKLA